MSQDWVHQDIGNDGLLAKEMVNVGGVKTRKTFVGYSTVLLAVIYAVGGSRSRLLVRDEVRRVDLCNTELVIVFRAFIPKCWLEEPGFDFRWGQDIFLISKAVHTGSGVDPACFWLGIRVIFGGVKFYSSLTSNAEFMNEWSYTSISPLCVLMARIGTASPIYRHSTVLSMSV